MKKIDILHMYAGTGGSAGLYIDELYSSLKDKYTQECIVNHYFSFSYGKKVYYKMTEMTGSNYLSKLPRVRLLLRMVELVLALLYSFFYILVRRPKVINYSMTSNFFVEYIFLKMIKLLTKSKLVITCHDVLPFTNNYSDIEVDIEKRKGFYKLADVLLVHNLNSKADLIKYFNILKLKIVMHKFPIMNLAKLANILNVNIDTKSNVDKPRRFLFVGHMRKEKGIDLLIEVWNGGEGVELIVAGNVPTGLDCKFQDIEDPNLKIINRFLNDEEYIKLISESDFVLLPYISGTNSGIPSSVVSLGAIPVTSNIDMFLNNELVDPQFVFRSGDAFSLREKLSALIALSSVEVAEAKNTSKDRFNAYKKDFDIEVKAVYDSLLSA